MIGLNTKHADCRIIFMLYPNTLVTNDNVSELIRKISPTYIFLNLYTKSPRRRDSCQMLKYRHQLHIFSYVSLFFITFIRVLTYLKHTVHSPYNESTCVVSDVCSMKSFDHRPHKYMVYPQYGFSNVLLNFPFLQMISHRSHNCKVSLQYGFCNGLQARTERHIACCIHHIPGVHSDLWVF